MKRQRLTLLLITALCSIFPMTGFCAELDVSADLLIWTAREAGADVWAELINTEGFLFPSRSNSLKEVHFPWDAGFRLKAFYGLKCLCLNTSASYTRFCTQGKDQVSGGPGTVHSAFLGNFYINNADGSGLSGPAYESASIRWTIDFNIFDWDIGWKLPLSQCLFLRPSLGIKGGWIDQSIHTTWENPSIIVPNDYQRGIENLKNDFWGIGPAAGLHSKWKIFAEHSNSISLIGDISGAMLWGHWSFDDLFQSDHPELVIVELQNVNSAASMIRTFIGFEWQRFFGINRCHFSTKVGFEMQFWLDQLKYYSFTGGRLENMLTLQGGTLEFFFGF